MANCPNHPARPLARRLSRAPAAATAMLSTPAGNIQPTPGANTALDIVEVTGAIALPAKTCSSDMKPSAAAAPKRPTRTAGRGCVGTKFAIPITVAKYLVRAHPADRRTGLGATPTAA